MEKFEYTQPEFLLCEIGIKDSSQNDGRLWIYHRLSLSLIEFVFVNNFNDFEFKGKQEFFQHNNENWFGVFVQNNTDITNNNENIILKKAWHYLKEYFIWEDNNIYKNNY